MEPKDFYNKTAHMYDQRHDNETTRYMRKHEMGLIKKYASGKTIELGCGTYLNVNNSVGLDISKGMLMQAKSKGHRKLVLGNMERLPVKNTSFDTAICMFNSINLCDMEKSVKEMRRILKPGGIAIVSMSSVWDSYNDNIIKRVFTKRESTNKKFRVEKERLWFHILNKNDFVELFEKNELYLVHFDGIFISQRPYWGWFRDFTLIEKMKLKIDRILPKRAARMYFGVFRLLKKN